MSDNDELCPDVPDNELREQLAACREDWQRICDVIGAKGEHMDPDVVVAAIAALAPASGGEVVRLPVPDDLIEQAARHACRVQGIDPSAKWLAGSDERQWERLRGTVASALHYAASQGRLITPTPQAAGVSDFEIWWNSDGQYSRGGGGDYEKTFAFNAWQAALTAAGSAPEGWVLVPREPTERMVVDGFESKPDPFFSPSDVWERYDAMTGCQRAAHRARLCWAAMLAAAPQPGAQGQLAVAEAPPEGDLLALQRFAVGILGDGEIGSLDGGDIQDTAEACGLLVPTEASASCGEGCVCASYGDFPMTCYRRSPILFRAYKADHENSAATPPAAPQEGA